jgi:DNA invertase Pin-like site-specific DNA recombinase
VAWIRPPACHRLRIGRDSGPCARADAEIRPANQSRPKLRTDDILDIARTSRQRGESVTAIARHLGIGRSTLYRALDTERDTVPIQDHL